MTLAIVTATWLALSFGALGALGRYVNHTTEQGN